MGVPKFPQLGLLRLWGPIISCANLWLQWGLKQSCSPCKELFNGMSHTTCTRGHWVDFRLLVVESQIASLIIGLSFDHNLCFRCPNDSCELILNIYVSITFRWYKEIFEPMGFDPWNRVIKIQESIWTPTPTMGVHLGVWGFIPSHSLHSLHSWEHVMWLMGLPFCSQPCNPFVLVASPRLGLRHLWFDHAHL